MFICNHFGWNKTGVLRIERKSRYHNYTCLYMLQCWIDMMCDNWIICSYVTILVEMKSVYQGLRGNQGTMVTYVFIWFRTIELIWYVIWVNDEYICNSYDWNKIRILGIEKKLGYRDYIWIYVVWLKWSQYVWLKWTKNDCDWK